MQLKELCLPGAPPALVPLLNSLGNHHELVQRIQATLVDSPPVSASDGGFIRAGYDAKLDELVSLRDNSEKLIVDLQNKYRQMTGALFAFCFLLLTLLVGISTLKIKQNRMLGYYIEVPARQEAKLLNDARFSHRQALVDRKRFVSDELVALETKLNSAASSVLFMELELLEALAKEVRHLCATLTILTLYGS